MEDVQPGQFISNLSQTARICTTSTMDVGHNPTLFSSFALIYYYFGSVNGALNLQQAPGRVNPFRESCATGRGCSRPCRGAYYPLGRL